MHSSQYFSRPTTVGATSIGLNTPDSELAENWGIYRIWIDGGGTAPDADHTSQQGELIVNAAGFRVERTDYWRAYTTSEINTLRKALRSELKDYMTGIYAQVSEHFGQGDDGPAVARDLLQASRDFAEAMCVKTANKQRDDVQAMLDQLGAQNGLDMTGIVLTGYSRDAEEGTIRINLSATEFEEEFSKQVKLKRMEERREVFVTVRNEINGFTLHSELSSYDLVARVDGFVAALP